ncbi:hypothetical protein [Amycolatopsis samaneae]|uniref:HEXXH motif-containing protein n=1 Tax=Amycolatopsis samaneae TaxID=664691 RepID=A0ABW5GSD3_9PSEU
MRIHEQREPLGSERATARAPAAAGHQARQFAAARLSPAEILEVQRTAGNRTAVAVQRAADPAATPEQVTRDLERLRALQENEDLDPQLRAVLAEVIAAADSVVRWNPAIPTSGHAHPSYSDDGVRNGFLVAYQGATEDEAQRLGNLVHELTHIAVYLGLDRSFVNYRHPDQAAVQDSLPAEQDGMEARQGRLMVGAANEVLIENLQELERLLPPDGGLRSDEQGAAQQVREKLRYGLMTPHKEYDTVLNQILTWTNLWGSDRRTPFYRRLVELATQARERRQGPQSLRTGNRVTRAGRRIAAQARRLWERVRSHFPRRGERT